MNIAEIEFFNIQDTYKSANGNLVPLQTNRLGTLPLPACFQPLPNHSFFNARL
jgi:hypothetical protein